MLKLSQIKLKRDEIKIRQRKIYKKIYESIVNAINFNAERGQKFCIFNVPSFILNEISYPFNECIDYLNYKMERMSKKKEITDVSFYQPNVYYIQWTFD